MGINLEDEPGVEKRSISHMGRTFIFILLALGLLPLLPNACASLPLPWNNKSTPAERSSAYYRRSNPDTVSEALATAELPHINYTSVQIDDIAGPLDPVHVKEGLLGIVNDSARPILTNGKVTGYVAGGQLYDAGGHIFGRTLAGANGTEIQNLESKVIGYIVPKDGKEWVVDPASTASGMLGERTAVVLDPTGFLIKAEIDGYDFNRTNR